MMKPSVKCRISDSLKNPLNSWMGVDFSTTNGAEFITVYQSNRTSIFNDRYGSQVFIFGKVGEYFFNLCFRLDRLNITQDCFHRDATGVAIGLLSGMVRVGQTADLRGRVQWRNVIGAGNEIALSTGDPNIAYGSEFSGRFDTFRDHLGAGAECDALNRS